MGLGIVIDYKQLVTGGRLTNITKKSARSGDIGDIDIIWYFVCSLLSSSNVLLIHMGRAENLAASVYRTDKSLITMDDFDVIVKFPESLVSLIAGPNTARPFVALCIVLCSRHRDTTPSDLCELNVEFRCSSRREVTHTVIIRAEEPI